jgi:hypothetical protein
MIFVWRNRGKPNSAHDRRDAAGNHNDERSHRMDHRRNQEERADPGRDRSINDCRAVVVRLVQDLFSDFPRLFSASRRVRSLGWHAVGRFLTLNGSRAYSLGVSIRTKVWRLHRVVGYWRGWRFNDLGSLGNADRPLAFRAVSNSASQIARKADRSVAIRAVEANHERIVGTFFRI